jgi:hypothetical protein
VPSPRFSSERPAGSPANVSRCPAARGSSARLNNCRRARRDR